MACVITIRQRGKLINTRNHPVNTTSWLSEQVVSSLGEADAKFIIARTLEELEVDRTTKEAGIRHASFEFVVDEKNFGRTKHLEHLIMTRMTTILNARPSSFTIRQLPIRSTSANNVRITCTLTPSRR